MVSYLSLMCPYPGHRLAPMQVDPKLLRDPQKDLPKPQPTSVVAKVS
jgi:hypothetical protein